MKTEVFRKIHKIRFEPPLFTQHCLFNVSYITVVFHRFLCVFHFDIRLRTFLIENNIYYVLLKTFQTN